MNIINYLNLVWKLADFPYFGYAQQQPQFLVSMQILDDMMAAVFSLSIFWFYLPKIKSALHRAVA